MVNQLPQNASIIPNAHLNPLCSKLCQHKDIPKLVYSKYNLLTTISTQEVTKHNEINLLYLWSSFNSFDF